MIKNNFLRAFLVISLVTVEVRCESIFNMEFVARVLRVGALAIGAKNFIYSKQAVQNVVDLQQYNIVDVLSPRSKEWIKNILLDQGLTQEQVQNVTLISGFKENNVEHIAAVLVGVNCIYLTFHQSYARTLNELVEKDILTDKEKETLNIFRFLVGHESIHIKKYYNSSFSLAGRKYQILCAGVGVASSWITYELLRYNDFSSIASTLIAYIPSIFVAAHSLNFALEEEEECDLCASSDPAILKAGADFFLQLYEDELSLAGRSSFKKFCTENKGVYAVFSKHPHPEDRVDYLYERAEELEEADQLSVQAA